MLADCTLEVFAKPRQKRLIASRASNPYRVSDLDGDPVDRNSTIDKDFEMNYEIRSETPADADAIRHLTIAAFEKAEHSSGTEAAIVDALRAAGVLTISLVAEVDGDVVGHVAFSPITINDQDIGWFGLGPVSVHPDRQGEGIGNALIRRGLEELRAEEAAGCVVLGDPNYYQRFGFQSDPDIAFPGAPQEYFMSISLDGSTAHGTVRYHESFGAS